MRTFLQHLNRDFEANILLIIGDFAGSWCFIDNNHPICRVRSGEYHRLRFNITKRRHLGQIYVERFRPEYGILERKWLKQHHWQPSYDVEMLMCCRGLQENLINLSNMKVNVANIQEQLKVCKHAMNQDSILVL